MLNDCVLLVFRSVIFDTNHVKYIFIVRRCDLAYLSFADHLTLYHSFYLCRNKWQKKDIYKVYLYSYLFLYLKFCAEEIKIKSCFFFYFIFSQCGYIYSAYFSFSYRTSQILNPDISCL